MVLTCPDRGAEHARHGIWHGETRKMNMNPCSAVIESASSVSRRASRHDSSMAKEEYVSVEATIRGLHSLAARTRAFYAEALRPDWRTMLISIATWFLYEAVRMSGRHDGKVFPRQSELCVIYSLLCFAVRSEERRVGK